MLVRIKANAQERRSPHIEKGAVYGYVALARAKEFSSLMRGKFSNGVPTAIDNACSGGCR
jgi:hypothetical protein